MKNRGFVFGMLAVAIAVVAIFLFQRKDRPVASVETPDTQSVLGQQVSSSELSKAFIRPHSPRFGNEMARVTVVEWLDPECEACSAMHPEVKRIISEYKDRVLFVIRYMPYHDGSMFAATALEEARELGRFEDALTVLFEKQPEWGNHQKPRPDLIPTYLANLGIPLENLDRDKLAAKHGERVRMDQEDGQTVGVKGTPSFFINERPLQELGPSQLRAAIDAALKATK
ncbi:MAG: thioredoxin domain-containing protein [Proteobacteria bacterium]|nr:thioredoxin domain-containing protein [Pseudomonadota bacterium]